jgi:hypothetical protein
MCQRLLSIDLVAFFSLAFTPGPKVTDNWLPYFPSGIAKIGPKHFLIGDFGDDIYRSEPLAQQAVLHVATSFTAAILHWLKPAHLDGGGWSATFANAVRCYLTVVLNFWGEEPDDDDDWNHNAVVLALKTLLRESPVDFVSLRQEIEGGLNPSLEQLKVLLDRFFDHICLDND